MVLVCWLLLPIKEIYIWSRHNLIQVMLRWSWWIGLQLEKMWSMCIQMSDCQELGRILIVLVVSYWFFVREGRWSNWDLLHIWLVRILGCIVRKKPTIILIDNVRKILFLRCINWNTRSTVYLNLRNNKNQNILSWQNLTSQIFHHFLFAKCWKCSKYIM